MSCEISIKVDRELVGASLIAKRLRCSERQLRRWVEAGIVAARKGPGRTSPLRMTVAEIEHYKARRPS